MRRQTLLGLQLELESSQTVLGLWSELESSQTSLGLSSELESRGNPVMGQPNYLLAAVP